MPAVGEIENKYLFGWDTIHISKSENRYDQIPHFGGDNSVVINDFNPFKS